MLPPNNHKVSTLVAQHHIMNIIRKTINHLNATQRSDNVSEEPVYALLKEVQFHYPL